MAYKKAVVATVGLWILGVHAFPAFPFGDHSVVGDRSRAPHDNKKYDSNSHSWIRLNIAMTDIPSTVILSASMRTNASN